MCALSAAERLPAGYTAGQVVLLASTFQFLQPHDTLEMISAQKRIIPQRRSVLGPVGNVMTWHGIKEAIIIYAKGKSEVIFYYICIFKLICILRCPTY